MRKYRKNTLLLVAWLDTEQDCKWMTKDKASDFPVEAVCFSVGFYTAHDAEYLYLSGTIAGERDKLSIPLGCIKHHWPILDTKTFETFVKYTGLTLKRPKQ